MSTGIQTQRREIELLTLYPFNHRTAMLPRNLCMHAKGPETFLNSINQFPVSDLFSLHKIILEHKKRFLIYITQLFLIIAVKTFLKTRQYYMSHELLTFRTFPSHPKRSSSIIQFMHVHWQWKSYYSANMRTYIQYYHHHLSSKKDYHTKFYSTLSR